MSNPIFAEHAKLNVFEFDLSRTYTYQLLSFGSAHNGMALHVYDDVEGYRASFGIHFLQVDYVLAPTRWKGGFFRSATNDECFHLRKSLKMHTPAKDLLSPGGWETNDYALFELATTNGVFVRILASRGVAIYDNWESFVQERKRQILERIQITDSNIPVFRYKDGTGVEKDFRVDNLLEILAGDYPVKEGYNVKPEDIQAALLFASKLIKKTYSSDL